MSERGPAPQPSGTLKEMAREWLGVFGLRSFSMPEDVVSLSALLHRVREEALGTPCEVCIIQAHGPRNPRAICRQHYHEVIVDMEEARAETALCAKCHDSIKAQQEGYTRGREEALGEAANLAFQCVPAGLAAPADHETPCQWCLPDAIRALKEAAR